jgi:hypothetical protein
MMADYSTTEAAPDDESADDTAATSVNNGRSAKSYLALIAHARRAFKSYNDRCDNIELQLANLERLAKATRDREYAMFWANLEVLKPSVYSRPPVPVVTTRFNDRRPAHREACEVLERCSIVNFEREDIDGTMRLIRDDLVVNARGVAWCWYEIDEKKQQRARVAHVSRKDFLHDASARYWSEVGWVARCTWLTRKEARKRFGKYSGNAYSDAAFAKQKDADGNAEQASTAEFWELWHKGEQRIVWVSAGCDNVLDEAKPEEMLQLDDFYPCPRPSYGTLKKDTLQPVPDFLFYKDQIEEVNELTARISSLSESLRLKGFYAGGAEDLADAIEKAVKTTNNNAILIPVSNFAAIGGQGMKESIVWLPLDVVATTIQACINIRKQLIDDIYQITGLSDVMRGATNPNETLGAQQLKSQYGSIRVRDKQFELVRIARDITRIQGEIIAENFTPETLLAMSQSDIPTVQQLQEKANSIHQQMIALQGKVKMAAQDPQAMQIAQQNPEQAGQLVQQAQQQMSAFEGQIQDLQNTVTIEAVAALLRDQRLRPFIMDIETDSTIQPDEDAAKQRVTEYTTAVGGFIAQSFPMVQAAPQLAPFVGEMLKFVSSPFRAGRALDGAIDDLVEQMQEYAKQPKPDPNAARAQADAQAQEREMQFKQQEAEQKAASSAQELEFRKQSHQMTMAEKTMDLRAKRQQANIDQNNALIAQGLPPQPDTEIDDHRAMLAQMASDREQTNALLAALTQALTAPKRIVRDGTGKPVGVEAVPTQSPGAQPNGNNFGN